MKLIFFNNSNTDIILKWNNSTDRITARNSHIIDSITSDNERYQNKK